MLGLSPLVPSGEGCLVKTNWSARIPWLLFGLALSTALAVILVGFKAQALVDSRPDPYWFSAMGRSLARGEGLSAYGSLLHRRAPLYPMMIAAIYRLLGEHELLVQIAQAVLFGGTSVLAYAIGRRVYNDRTGLIAGVLCAVHPALLRYVADFHLETLFTFLLTASVLLGVRFYQKPCADRAHQGRRRAAPAVVRGLLVDQSKALSDRGRDARRNPTGDFHGRYDVTHDRAVDCAKLHRDWPPRADQHRFQ